MANAGIPLDISLEDVGLGKAYNESDYEGMSVKDVFDSLSDADKNIVYNAVALVMDGRIIDAFTLANTLCSKLLSHQWKVVKFLMIRAYEDYEKGEFDGK